MKTNPGSGLVIYAKDHRRLADFYARVATEMPGVRLGDAEARMLADAAVADWLWIQHKLARGELSAAQHVLHRSLAETNFRLLRELRLRRGQPLPSFGLGRHVERLLGPEELAWVRVDARCEAEALWSATERAAEGLRALMTELVGDDRSQDRALGLRQQVVVEDHPPARADAGDRGVEAGPTR